MFHTILGAAITLGFGRRFAFVLYFGLGFGLHFAMHMQVLHEMRHNDEVLGVVGLPIIIRHDDKVLGVGGLPLVGKHSTKSKLGCRWSRARG